MTTLDGGCDPDECTDFQFAVYDPAEADNGRSEADVHWWLDPANLTAVGMKQQDADAFAGTVVPKTFSVLLRTEDSVTFILQTNLKASDSRKAANQAAKAAAKAAKATAKAAKATAKAAAAT